MPPLRVISVVSNKGGVGKTTIATNLAVYLRALREDVPILMLGLDDQDLIERMFALEAVAPSTPTLLDALHARDLRPAIRLGQHAVHYVPSSPTLSTEASGLRDPETLRALLVEAGWSGLVVIDTKGDLGILTQNALAASDLALVVVSDRGSLEQAERIYGLLEGWGRPRSLAPVVLSLVDRRVRYHDGENADLLALLISEVRRRGHPLLESFVSRSPRIESLYTNRERRARSILHAARGSLVHRQLTELAHDVLRRLELADPALADARPAVPAVVAEVRERRGRPRRPFTRRIAGFAFTEPPILALRAHDLSSGGIAVEPSAELARAGRVHLALAGEGAGERLLVWARVLRTDPGRMALRFEVDDDDELRHRLTSFVEQLAPSGAPA